MKSKKAMSESIQKDKNVKCGNPACKCENCNCGAKCTCTSCK